MNYRDFAKMGMAPQDVVKTYYAHLYDGLQDIPENPIPETTLVVPLGNPARYKAEYATEDRGKDMKHMLRGFK